MSELTIKTWCDIERNAFDNFTPMLASRFEEGILRTIVRTLRKMVAKTGSAELVLPWGTYRVETKTMGEAGNRAPSWEPSKGFIKLLNGGSMDGSQKLQAITQDEFSDDFLKDFREFVAYGFFDPDSPENKDKNIKKGVKLTDDEAVYFLNSYATVLATIGKDKERDGKIFRLEVNNGYPHGSFDFEYDDDEIKVKWVADKVFKQILKDDDAAAKSDDATFDPIREAQLTTIPVDGKGQIETKKIKG